MFMKGKRAMREHHWEWKTMVKAGDTCPKCGNGKMEDIGLYVHSSGWLECMECGYIEV